MDKPLDETIVGSVILKVTAGPANGATLAVSSSPLVLGRDANSPELVADGRVSRRHAEIHSTRTGMEILDLGSANGTYVNGTQLTGRTALTLGDRVRIGDTELVITLAEQAARAPAGAAPDWLGLGRQRFEHGDLAGSRDAFQRAVDATGSVEGHYGLGMVALTTGDVDAATRAFSHAIGLNPHHANALYQLGALAERDGDQVRARQWYTRSVAANPAHKGSQARLRALGTPLGGTGELLDPGSAPAPDAPVLHAAPGEPGAPLVPLPMVAGGFGPGVMSLLEQDPNPVSVQTIELMHQLDMETRPRLVAVIGRHMLLLVVLALVSGVLLASLLSSEDGAGAGVVVLLALIFVTTYAIALVKTTRFRIAHGRLQIERGIVHRRLDNVDLWRVLNVNLDRTLLNRMTSDGTLELLLAVEPTDLSRRARSHGRLVKVTGLASGAELTHIHQSLLNLAFLLRGNPIVKGIIQ